MTTNPLKLPELLAIIARDLTATCQRCGGAGTLKIDMPNHSLRYDKCPADCTNGVTHPFRVVCNNCKGSGKESKLHPEAGGCTSCQSRGYIPREPHELADVLWKAGWYVRIEWLVPRSRKPYCFALVLAKGKGDEMSESARSTDADLALVQACVQALGGMK